MHVCACVCACMCMHVHICVYINLKKSILIQYIQVFIACWHSYCVYHSSQNHHLVVCKLLYKVCMCGYVCMCVCLHVHACPHLYVYRPKQITTYSWPFSTYKFSLLVDIVIVFTTVVRIIIVCKLLYNVCMCMHACLHMRACMWVHKPKQIATHL